MLQRIQTIFLALVLILGIVFSFVPSLEFFVGKTNEHYIMIAYKTVAINDATIVIAKNMGVGVLQGLVFLVALIAIFLFKNRSLQIKLCKLNILLIAIQIVAIVMYSDVAKKATQTNPSDVSVSYQLGAIIPVISLILTYLAIHFIKKDDKLVKAADRLR